MNRNAIAIDPSATRLRRVGRLARRRMRIEGPLLANGLHTDGTLTIEISGLGSPVAGVPDSFAWEADRPIALVIVRSGIDGDDVTFQVGPSRFGTGLATTVGDGTGIRYVAFCYDAAPNAASSVPAMAPSPAGQPAAVLQVPSAVERGIAAARALAPTRRDRRSILGLILQGQAPRPATT